MTAIGSTTPVDAVRHHVRMIMIYRYSDYLHENTQILSSDISAFTLFSGHCHYVSVTHCCSIVLLRFPRHSPSPCTCLTTDLQPQQHPQTYVSVTCYVLFVYELCAWCNWQNRRFGTKLMYRYCT